MNGKFTRNLISHKQTSIMMCHKKRHNGIFGFCLNMLNKMTSYALHAFPYQLSSSSSWSYVVSRFIYWFLLILLHSMYIVYMLSVYGFSIISFVSFRQWILWLFWNCSKSMCVLLRGVWIAYFCHTSWSGLVKTCTRNLKTKKNKKFLNSL